MIRRLVILILAYWAPAYCTSTVTAYVSTPSTTNATSYVSGSFTPNAGDLLFALVVASGTQDQGSMKDSQNVGFALAEAFTPYASSANAIYIFVAARFAANTAMTVTYQTPGTTATGAIIFVGGVSGMLRTGPAALKQITSVANHASGTPTITFSNSVLTGDPAIAVIGNSTNPAFTSGHPPSSWTENSDTGYATPTTGAEWVSINSGFTGTAVTWGTSSASAWGGIAAEFDTSAVPSVGVWPNCGATAPCVIQDVQTSFPGESEGPAFYFRYPNKTIAGNLLVLRMAYDQQETTSSVTSDCGGTWVEGPHAGAGTGQEQFDSWYLLNNAGNCQLVTVTLSGALSGNNFFTSGLTEVSGISTSSAIDGTSIISSSTGMPTLQPGAITTTQNGDFIFNMVEWNHPFDPFINHTPVIGITPDSNSVLVEAHAESRMAAQFTIQPTSGSINPTMYADDPDASERPWYSAAIAFKASSGAGAQPAAGSIRIVRWLWALNTSSTAQTDYFQFPTTGNLRLMYTAADVFEGWTITNVGDRGNASYTELSTTGNCTASYNTNFPQFWYSANTTGDQLNFGTFTQPAIETWIEMVDVANAKTAPFDTCAVANGTQGSTNADITSAPVYTPSVSTPELVIAVQTDANGPTCGTIINNPAACNSTSTVGFTYDAIWATAATDLGNFSFGDGYQHTTVSSTSTLNFGYHMLNGTTTTWHSLAIGFEQAPASSSPVNGKAIIF